jgi:hypothetical protein
VRKKLACAVLACLLTACGATMQTVKVPVPVPCGAKVPDRPAMPTESLKPGAGLDAFVQAAAAEIERREGYEGELRAALEGCVKPIEAPPALSAAADL